MPLLYACLFSLLTSLQALHHEPYTLLHEVPPCLKKISIFLCSSFMLNHWTFPPVVKEDLTTPYLLLVHHKVSLQLQFLYISLLTVWRTHQNMIVDFEQRESFPAARTKKPQSSIFNFSSSVRPLLPPIPKILMSIHLLPRNHGYSVSWDGFFKPPD